MFQLSVLSFFYGALSLAIIVFRFHCKTINIFWYPQTNPAVKSAVQSVSGQIRIQKTKCTYCLAALCKSLPLSNFLAPTKFLQLPFNNLVLQSDPRSQVRQGSRGMKAAYKDLRSKLREKPASHNHSFGEASMSQSHHADASGSSASSHGHSFGSQMHSAPNSPVFTKKHNNFDLSHHKGHRSSNPNHHHQNTAHHNHHPKTHTTRNSFAVAPSTKQSSNSINNNNHVENEKSTLAVGGSTPSSSSSASNSTSSEMNLLQELQQHALFRAALVVSSKRFSLLGHTSIFMAIICFFLSVYLVFGFYFDQLAQCTQSPPKWASPCIS